MITSSEDQNWRRRIPSDVSDRFEPPTRPRFPTTFPQLLRRRDSLTLAHVGARMSRMMEYALTSCGMDSRQYAVLALLAAAGGPMPQQVIALRLGRDRSTVMRLVTQLESKGLVQRRCDPVDGRVKSIHLTGRGKERLQSAETNLDAAEMEFFGMLSPAEAQQLFRMIERLSWDERAQVNPEA